MGCSVTVREAQKTDTQQNMSVSENRPKLTLREFANEIKKVCKSAGPFDDTDSASPGLKKLQIKAGDRWQDVLENPVYGRVCTNTTSKLAAAPGRKTAFVFGPETFLGEPFFTKSSYELLLHLGFLPEYIHYKACVQKSQYWIVLFSPEQDSNHTPVLPATWDGLREFLTCCYPEASSAILNHWSVIQTEPVEYFEQQAGFKFIQAVSDPSGPLYMNYEKFLSLPKPQKEWEARCFLYCELRIFELFSGDGLTKNTEGSSGEKEYICLNYEKEQLGEDNFVAIPLQIDIPEDVKTKFESQKK